MTTTIGTDMRGPVLGDPPPRSLWQRYRWIASRVGFGILTIFVVSVVIFVITTLLPGDAAVAILGPRASPERVAALRDVLGLDLPAGDRYVSWLLGMLRGDFGTSLISGRPVAGILWPRVANTLTLIVLTGIIAIPVSIALGLAAAFRPGRLGDATVNGLSIVIAALPEFVIGLLLIALFAVNVFTWLPAVSLVPTGQSPLASPAALVLPVTTLVLLILPYLSRQVRASLLDVLSSEYIVMAEMKGLSRLAVLFRHALPNGLQPIIQAAALSLAFLLGGTVVTEYLFQFPGIGYTLTDATRARDVPLVQACVLILAVGYVAFNLIADVLTVVVTPKLRTR